MASSSSGKSANDPMMIIMEEMRMMRERLQRIEAAEKMEEMKNKQEDQRRLEELKRIEELDREIEEKKREQEILRRRSGVLAAPSEPTRQQRSSQFNQPTNFWQAEEKPLMAPRIPIITLDECEPSTSMRPNDTDNSSQSQFAKTSSSSSTDTKYENLSEKVNAMFEMLVAMNQKNHADHMSSSFSIPSSSHVNNFMMNSSSLTSMMPCDTDMGHIPNDEKDMTEQEIIQKREELDALLKRRCQQTSHSSRFDDIEVLESFANSSTSAELGMAHPREVKEEKVLDVCEQTTIDIMMARFGKNNGTGEEGYVEERAESESTNLGGEMEEDSADRGEESDEDYEPNAGAREASKNIECKLCNKSFERVAWLLRHKNDVHGLKNALTCEMCGEMFSSTLQMTRHLNLEYEIFKCSGCSKTFSDSYKMRVHKCESASNSSQSSSSNQQKKRKSSSTAQPTVVLKKPKPSNDKSLMELIQDDLFVNSPTSFTDFESHGSHDRKMHDHSMVDDFKTENNVTMNSTMNSTLTDADSSKVFLSEEDEKMMQFNAIFDSCKCYSCDKRFPSRLDLEKHKRNDHKMHKYQCSFCAKILESASGFKTHMNVELRSYVCLRCTQPLNSKGRLRDHVAKRNCREKVSGVTPSKTVQHPNDGVRLGRPYCVQFCYSCDMRFDTFAETEAHKLNAHDLQRYQCDFCNKLLESAPGFRKHMNVELKAHQCERCKTAFSSGQRLQEHIEADMCVFRVDNQAPTPKGSTNGGNHKLKCYECPVLFPNREKWTEHRKEAHGLEQFECHICKKVCSSAEAFKYHMAIELKLHHCEGCDKLFGNGANLKDHLEKCLRKTDEDMYKCHVCDTNFHYHSQLMDHRKNDHDLDRYQCDFCRKVFETDTGFRYHMNIELKKFQCERCQSVHGSTQKLLDHLRSCTVKTDDDLFKCFSCEEVLFTRIQWWDHRKKEHGLDRYQCDFCDKTMETSTGFRYHMSVELKKFRCEKCDDAFGSKPRLEEHLLVCQNEQLNDSSREAALNRVKCHVCSKGFKTRDKWAEHRKEEHNLNRFQCDICRTSDFNSLEGYKRHMNIELKTYECEKCKQCFGYSSRLVQHVERDNCLEGRQYECTVPQECYVCEETFNTKEKCATHRKVVHGLEPLQCHLCKKEYHSWEGLKYHMNMELKKHQCTICGACFGKERAKVEHEEDCTNGECLKCGQIFDTPWKLGKHKMKCRKKKRTSFKPKQQSATTTLDEASSSAVIDAKIEKIDEEEENEEDGEDEEVGDDQEEQEDHEGLDEEMKDGIV